MEEDEAAGLQMTEKTCSFSWEDEEEEDTEEEEEDHQQRKVGWDQDDFENSIAEPRGVGDTLRAEFLQSVILQPPATMRVIDIEATCIAGHVMLVDYQQAQESACGYSAISHTYGLEIYKVFDCPCACNFSCSTGANIPPRCWDQPCLHGHAGKEKDQRDRVVGDILGMCLTLRKAGVVYAWHDGVCIAQHDEEEVKATIQCMGWIYSSARETIVFLHYVGKPMAPISPRGSGYDLICRWHTRVWTLQEAALSKMRRYCVRVCNSPVSFENCRFHKPCHTLKKFVEKSKKFEHKIGIWYESDTSEIDVITEDRFVLDFLKDAQDASCSLWLTAMRLKVRHPLWNAANEALGLDEWLSSLRSWYSCLDSLKNTLNSTCLGFPALATALVDCSRRDSKHVGDRINSVLTLAKLNNFVAPKDFETPDDCMEAWTIEFFKRQGQEGLAWALFSTNVGHLKDDDMQKSSHTWVPLLWRTLKGPEMCESQSSESWGIDFKVCGYDRRLQLKGELVCVAVTFTLQLKAATETSNTEQTDEERFEEVHVTDEPADMLQTDEGIYDTDDEESSHESEESEDANYVAELLRMRDRLDLELTTVVDGFVDFMVMLVGSNITMGVATFFPIQHSKWHNGRLIAGYEMKEGQSFDAYLVAPLHYDWELDWQPVFIIVQGSLEDHVSKIGTFTMFTKPAGHFGIRTDKSAHHSAFRIIEELVIH